MIAIIDYGAGNLNSVKKAFDYLKVENEVVSHIEGLKNIDRMVLPGVGAFGAAINQLKKAGMFEFVQDWLLAGKSFLGICLGLQMLFENSAETEGIAGLAVLKGTNLRFNQGKVPQIGWNQIKAQRPSPLLQGIEDDSFFYFLHSYYIAPQQEDVVVATAEYHITYPAVIQKGKVFATQFHPEKSGTIGLKLLKNWVELC
jgi:imidazole glycerol-phosphate synthase subunit HisH